MDNNEYLITLQINVLRLAMFIDSLTTILTANGSLSTDEYEEVKSIYYYLMSTNKEIKDLEEQLELYRSKLKVRKETLN